MRLRLPKRNIILPRGDGEVTDGILYIDKPCGIKSVMYALTYDIYGNDTCYFCGRKLRTNPSQKDNSKYFPKISIDHLYSTKIGGPMITNNMRPVCTECNSKKGDMTEKEFLEYLEITKRAHEYGKFGQQALSLFKENIKMRRRLIASGNEESIPNKWLWKGEIETVNVTFWTSQRMGKTYFALEEDIKTYGYTPKTVMITRNGYLVDGLYVLILSKKYNIPIRYIVLENAYYRSSNVSDISFESIL